PTQPLALVIAPTIPALRRGLTRVGTDVKLGERLRCLARPTRLLGPGGFLHIDSDSRWKSARCSHLFYEHLFYHIVAMSASRWTSSIRSAHASREVRIDQLEVRDAR